MCDSGCEVFIYIFVATCVAVDWSKDHLVGLICCNFWEIAVLDLRLGPQPPAGALQSSSSEMGTSTICCDDGLDGQMVKIRLVPEAFVSLSCRSWREGMLRPRRDAQSHMLRGQRLDLGTAA
jgi:hypothetical protein